MVTPPVSRSGSARSAGLLVHRRRDGELQVLLVHPGGPFWARRDAGAWSIPKGEYVAGAEEPLAAARREFAEELGVPAPAGEPRDLGEVRQRSGKRVRAFSLAGDLDVEVVRSNMFEMEWPPRSGRTAAFPEVDRAAWFGLAAAREKINPAQAAFLDRLGAAGGGGGRAVTGSEAISPTAHYTGEVWSRNGLSHPWLATPEGRAMFLALEPLMRASAAAGGPTLEAYLLARHRAIDVLLERAIERDGISQVLEIATGMSPRGWRFALRFGGRVDYWEADLPEMAARKRAALERIGSLGDHHHVVELDALRRAGPRSLDSLLAGLDPGRGLVVITEGLLGYLTTSAVLDLWERLARGLRDFTGGRYISDIHLGSVQSPLIRAFRLGLAAFVRGGVHLHFTGAADVEARLRLSGFATAAVRPAARIAELPGGGGASLAHILEASTR